MIQGHIPVSTAVQAPGAVAADGQRAWLQAVMADREAPSADAQEQGTTASASEATTVRRARQLTRLLLGRPAPDRVCDRQLRAWYQERALPEELVADALMPAAPPDLSDPTWPDDRSTPDDDPTVELLGPWRPPRDLADALQLIDEARAVRNKRRATLGRLLDEVQSSEAFRRWGFDSLDDWVRAELDLSVRTAWRLRKQGRALRISPLADAVDAGLSLARADAIRRLVSTTRQARQWLAVVEQVPMADLQAATRAGRPGERLDAYQQLLHDAPALVERALAAHTRAPAVPAPLPETGAIRLGPTTRKDIKVALHPPSPEEELHAARHRPLRADRALIEAATWLLDTVKLPPQRGCGRIKDDQHYTCQNPECRRRSLRMHAHHDRPRAQGGTDDIDNLRCLCPSCHLRLVHGGYMAIVRVDDAHVYLYPGRAVVVR